MITRRLLSAFVILSLVGCRMIHGDYPRNRTFVPDANLKFTPSYSMTLEDTLLIAGIAYLTYKVVDPEAPAWKIRETSLAQDRILFSLSMKPVSFGGDGEASQVLRRRAAALATERGYKRFEIVRYEEGIDSKIWLTQRSAEAEVVLREPRAVTKTSMYNAESAQKTAK